jgi:peptide/nickel transport system permease protein
MDIIRLLSRNKLTIIGMVIVILFLLTAAVAPILAPADPLEITLKNRLKPPGWIDGEGKCSLLGTDNLGRDVLSRIIFGSRVSFQVGTISVLLGMAIGLILGLGSGYFGGIVDQIIMRLVDIQLSMPFILLAMTIIALIGPGVYRIIIVFALTNWVVYARVVRASTLSVKEMDFVKAARTIGLSHAKIISKHILPNVFLPLIVIASVQVAQVIMYEAAFGFFGLGVPPPTPTWGNMLSDGREYLSVAWWVGTFPGLAIVMVVFGINVLGDGFRDVLDPKTYSR